MKNLDLKNLKLTPIKWTFDTLNKQWWATTSGSNGEKAIVAAIWNKDNKKESTAVKYKVFTAFYRGLGHSNTTEEGSAPSIEVAKKKVPKLILKQMAMDINTMNLFLK